MQIPTAGNWTFNDEQIARRFDSHVREQLPWYDLATNIVEHVVMHYLRDGILYDIGASTGNITNKLKRIIEQRNAKAISIEQSAEMCALFSGHGEIININANQFEPDHFDVAVLFLVCMFMSQKEVDHLLKKLKTKMNKGGCIIIFDKLEPDEGYMSIVSSRLALKCKLDSGATPEEILQKELSLSGIQRPLKKEFIKQGSLIFKFGDFFGLVIEEAESESKEKTRT